MQTQKIQFLLTTKEERKVPSKAQGDPRDINKSIEKMYEVTPRFPVTLPWRRWWQFLHGSH